MDFKVDLGVHAKMEVVRRHIQEAASQQEVCMVERKPSSCD